MVSGVINNTTNAVKIYTICTNNKDTIDLPYLEDMSNEQFNNTIVIGEGSSADAILEKCTTTSKYLLLCIWKSTFNTGKPNSWLLYDFNDRSIVKTFINNYTATLGGNFNAGYIITIRASPGGNIWLYIIALFILAVIGISIWVFYGITPLNI
jgi:hypothetical protein